MLPEIPPERLLESTKRLIEIPSVTSNKEANRQALNLISLELDCFSREEFIHPEDGTESLLFYNTDQRPEEFRVLLHAHLDVVPAQNPDQFTPRQEGKKLYGRGAQDMKSGAAVMIAVFKEVGKSLSYPVGLSITTDEEVGGFHGAKYQVQQGIRAELVISGESTQLKIGNQHKGVLILECECETQGGHTAYNGDDDNALLQQVKFQYKVNEIFPGPDGTWRTTSSLTKLDTSNTAHNVVPNDAHSELSVRYIPEDNPYEIQQKIESINKNIKIRRGPFGLAHNTPQNHPDMIILQQVISQVTGRKAEFQGLAGASDLRHWTETGAAGADFGPTGKGLHTAEEFLEIDSLQQYATILMRFLNSIEQ